MKALPVAVIPRGFLSLELMGVGDFNNRVLVRARDVIAIAENGSNYTLDVHLPGVVLKVRGVITELSERLKAILQVEDV